MQISIIVPMLNEAPILPGLLSHLSQFVRQGAEVLLVDGGSDDTSLQLARAAGFAALGAPRGRASQMNAGAMHATGDVLLFLHADTRLPATALQDIRHALARSRHVWGRFDVTIQGQSPWFPLIARLMNLRSRITGIATGDQGIFVTREAFFQVGCYPNQPLMEDIELSMHLKRLSPPACLRAAVTTSGRRWETRGVWRTILLMWTLRLRYFLGANPEALAKAYR